MPENLYFRQKETQRILLDVLFTFCRLNPDVGYRQGMHEIAALILWVVEGDAVDIGVESKALGEDSIIKAVFDAEHIEHDTFTLFGEVMQSAKSFYISEGPVSIASRSRHIFEELLPQVDAKLMKHLESLDIVPQVFLIRWIRLLFGREFDFDAVLALWDLILAEDSSLEIVDHICLAMLLRIRWHLLDADYNNALALLLRYPALEKDFPAQTLGLDALYLQNHMSAQGGSYLVLKYTGRPSISGRPTTPPALQRNITIFPERRSGLSPTRTTRQTRNLETMLQNTAKNIYARSEKLGIGKAMRSAVDEVHKKAQEIRDAQVLSPRRTGTGPLAARVNELEARSKRLSALLAGAVSELWEYQKLIADENREPEHAQREETIEKLSAAIAKVQFVQVYLDEPSLTLGDEESEAGLLQDTSAVEGVTTGDMTGTGQKESQANSEKAQYTEYFAPQTNLASSTTSLADPLTFEDLLEQGGTPRPEAPPMTSVDSISTSAREPALTIHTPEAKPLRPPLEESPFSFMLGQDSSSRGLAGASSPPTRAANRANVSLFGTEHWTQSVSLTPLADRLGVPLGDTTERKEDEFDMGSLRRAKGGRK